MLARIYFMSNAAIDYEKQNALNNARMEPPRAENFRVPQSGRADNYLQEGQADNYANEDGGGEDHASRLDAARNRMAKSDAAKSKDALGDAAELATPMGAFSLLKNIDPMKDMPYAAALLAAIAKDVITLATFETVILPIIFSALCSIFIFMMLLLVGSSGKRKGANALLKKGLFLLGGGIFGSIPGLDIFPFETLTVGIIYYMELSERKHAK